MAGPHASSWWTGAASGLDLLVFIAAFQAVEKSEDGKECAIWALDVDWWKRNVKKRIPRLRKVRELEDPHSDKEFKVIRTLTNNKGIWPVNPFRLNERLQSQQGVFLLPLDGRHTFMDNLKHRTSPSKVRPHLWKIIIYPNRTFRRECLTELQRMNIQNQSLFRGLDGLAKDLESQMLMENMFRGIEPRR